MTPFTTVEGDVVYVDCFDVVLVTPCYEAAGQSLGLQGNALARGKLIGSRLIFRTIPPLTVTGDASANARVVGDAKGRPVPQS